MASVETANVGIFHHKKGEEMNEEENERTVSSPSQRRHEIGGFCVIRRLSVSVVVSTVRIIAQLYWGREWMRSDVITGK